MSHLDNWEKSGTIREHRGQSRSIWQNGGHLWTPEDTLGTWDTLGYFGTFLKYFWDIWGHFRTFGDILKQVQQRTKNDTQGHLWTVWDNLGLFWTIWYRRCQLLKAIFWILIFFDFSGNLLFTNDSFNWRYQWLPPQLWTL